MERSNQRISRSRPRTATHSRSQSRSIPKEMKVGCTLSYSSQRRHCKKNMTGTMNPRCAINTKGNCVLKNTAETRMILYKPMSPIRNKELERSFLDIIQQNRDVMNNLLNDAKKAIASNDMQTSKQTILGAYSIFDRVNRTLTDVFENYAGEVDVSKFVQVSSEFTHRVNEIISVHLLVSINNEFVEFEKSYNLAKSQMENGSKADIAKQIESDMKKALGRVKAMVKKQLYQPMELNEEDEQPSEYYTRIRQQVSNVVDKAHKMADDISARVKQAVQSEEKRRQDSITRKINEEVARRMGKVTVEMTEEDKMRAILKKLQDIARSSGDSLKTFMRMNAVVTSGFPQVILCTDNSSCKSAYRKMAILFHPDKYTDKPNVGEIATQIFHVLSDAYQRL